MNHDTTVGADWRKATYSNGQGSCVEVGHASRQVMIRDTTQAAMGSARTVLDVTPAAWTTFTASVK